MYNLKARINGVIVDVNMGRGASLNMVEHALNSHIFQKWAKRVDPAFGITGISVNHVDYRGEPSAETVLNTSLAVRGTGLSYETYMSLRDEAVILIPVFSCGGRGYTVLVVQDRLQTGQCGFQELTAGMCEGDESLLDTVIREAREELGLTIERESLTNIGKSLWGMDPSDHPQMYTSPGFSSEIIHVFTYCENVSADFLESLRNRRTGLKSEGESITLKVIPLAELVRHTRDMKSLAAYMLLLQFMR
jgi:8-oxo-dGTP pyrophosphatase MutT (NUDIX family)